MRSFSRIIAVLLVMAVLSVLSLSARAMERVSFTGVGSVAKGQIQVAYGRLPLSFEANRGQVDAPVDFLARGKGYIVFLRAREAVLSLRVPTATSEGARLVSTTTVRIQLTGANAQPRVTGLDEPGGRVNYFVGKDPARWRINVPTHAKVRYEEIYPGIDLVWHGTMSQLEYDFVVRPGADPSRIVVDFHGTEKVEVDARGDLVLHTAAGAIRQRKPVIYQEFGGRRREIRGGYLLRGAAAVGFQIAAYDRNRPLVIDPVLLSSTYLGGSDVDIGRGIAVDSAGHAYVTGSTRSPDFPITPGVPQAANGNPIYEDVFVTKLDVSGSGLTYSTYIGGLFVDIGRSIAVDADGNVYVTGRTESYDFPTTAGAFQMNCPGAGVFVVKLNPTGSALAYSTCIGLGDGNGIAVDAAGNAYVTGFTGSSDFPTTPGAFQSAKSLGYDAFVTKVNPTGSGLVYSTYLGGGGPDLDGDRGNGIAVDTDGNAYVTGRVGSPDFPTTSISFQACSTGGGFVTKLNGTGSELVYSTCLGGEGRSITVDGARNAYVTGRAWTAFLTTPGAFQTTFGGSTDAFVTKVNPSGSELVYATYLGGAGHDAGLGIAADAFGNAYVTGHTYSMDFPTIQGAFQAASGGYSDAFVTKLNPTGSELVYSTFLGGVSDDAGLGIAVDILTNAYVTGYTYSSDFPATLLTFDATPNGASDAFVAKITDIALPVPPSPLQPLGR